jgi:hypothetical protein
MSQPVYGQYTRPRTVYDIALSEYTPMSRYRSLAARGDRPLSDSDIIWAPRQTSAVSLSRNITDHSCLKVYHKDPAQAFSHGPRPTNGDARVSTLLSVLYTSFKQLKIQCFCLWKIHSGVDDTIILYTILSCFVT